MGARVLGHRIRGHAFGALLLLLLRLVPHASRRAVRGVDDPNPNPNPDPNPNPKLALISSPSPNQVRGVGATHVARRPSRIEAYVERPSSSTHVARREEGGGAAEGDGGEGGAAPTPTLPSSP